jgi:hypothetical protein
MSLPRLNQVLVRYSRVYSRRSLVLEPGETTWLLEFKKRIEWYVNLGDVIEERHDAEVIVPVDVAGGFEAFGGLFNPSDDFKVVGEFVRKWFSQLSGPQGICCDNDAVYVSEYGNNRIQAFM